MEAHQSYVGTLVERTTCHRAQQRPGPRRAGHWARWAAGPAVPLADLGSGHQMVNHARFTRDTGAPVYFAEPRSPLQRGVAEQDRAGW